MPLFKVNGSAAQKMPLLPVKLEKDIQTLFENNLETLLGVVFLATEYVTSWGGRIDTLGIDEDGTPVIIEYKRDEDANIINQGITYLEWLEDHKIEFEALCKGKGITTKVDWESPRVLCIARKFNKFDFEPAKRWQRQGTRVELWQCQKHEDDVLSLESKVDQRSSEESKSSPRKTDKETYTMASHLEKGSEDIKKIFSMLREKIMSLDERVIEIPQSVYIKYKASKTIVVIQVQKSQLKIYFNLKHDKISDPKKIATDQTKVDHVGRYEWEVTLDSEKQIEDVFLLIEQSYDNNG